MTGVVAYGLATLFGSSKKADKDTDKDKDTEAETAEYDLFLNNCEHFVNWAITGTSESGQVQTAAAVAVGVGVAAAVGYGLYTYFTSEEKKDDKKK